MFECVISSIVDEFPWLRAHKLLFTLGMCCLLFLLGLPCVTEGGMYVLHLMDTYSAAFSLMIISLFEAVVIAWVYGVDRFCEDIHMMIRRRPGKWWRLCWKFITPIVIAFIFVFTVISYETISYGDYQYPTWAVFMGWAMALCSMVPIPVCAIIHLLRAKGTFQERLVSCLRPSDAWGPALEEHRARFRDSIAEQPSRFPQEEVADLHGGFYIHRGPEDEESQSKSTLPATLTAATLLPADSSATIAQ